MGENQFGKKKMVECILIFTRKMARVTPDDFTDGGRFIGKVSTFVSSERESANEGNTCDTNCCGGEWRGWRRACNWWQRWDTTDTSPLI